MPHKHSTYDTDPHFTINPLTRKIVNQTAGKTKIMQFDHNSERFTFELPRLVDGHDMSLCDKIEIHYINVSANGGQQNADIYPVSDVAINKETDTVYFSWLISQNATQIVGSLNFIICFKCLDGDNITYRWNTDISEDIKISNGMDNTEGVIIENPDVLEVWKTRVFSDIGVNVGDITEAAELAKESATTAKNAAVQAERAAVQAERAAELAETSAPTAKVERTDNGAVITVTDKNGTTSETVVSADGASAYEIWLEVGNNGTKEDFIASLKGEAGKSPYDIAAESGFEGTEAEFNKLLANFPEFVSQKVFTIADFVDITYGYLSPVIYAVDGKARIYLPAGAWVKIRPTGGNGYDITANETDITEILDFGGCESLRVEILSGAEKITITQTKYRVAEIEKQIGDIDAALDELHSYAQALISGGVAE